VLEADGEVEIRYKTYLEVASPERLREHVMTILDLHSSNWKNTDFGGRVRLNCWNEKVSKRAIKEIQRQHSEVVVTAQFLVDHHGIRNTDGNRIVLEFSFSNKAVE
jgi:hypothetical protein